MGPGAQIPSLSSGFFYHFWASNILAVARWLLASPSQQPTLSPTPVEKKELFFPSSLFFFLTPRI